MVLYAKEINKSLSSMLWLTALLSIVTLLSGARLFSVAFGILFLSPLSISILGEKELSFPALISEAFRFKSLYYTVLFVALWIIPICIPAFLTYFVQSEYVTVFLAIPAYSFLYSRMAPTFYEIATGVKGVPLLVNDVLRIMLTLMLFTLFERGFSYVATINLGTKLIALLGISFIFVMTFCLQSAIVLRRNQAGGTMPNSQE